MKRLFVLFCFLITSIAIIAQSPKYSNEFLTIGVGARALGMSNSQVAIVNDVTSGYWNPAGLMKLQSDMQVSLMHSEYFAGIAKYDYGAFAKKIDSTSSFGISIIRFGVDDIPNTTELIDNEGNINYDRITSFSAVDYAFVLSYAKKSKIKGLNYGANVKIIHRRIGDFANAWGFGLDIGAQYDVGKWHFGALGKDITTTFNAWNYSLNENTKEVFTSTGNEIPENSLELTMPRLIIGAGRKVKISEKITSLIVLDFDVTFDGKRNVLIKSDPVSIDPHLGIELAYEDFIYVRCGIGNFQEEPDISGKKTISFQPNMGLGIKIKNTVFIDYALTDIGDQSVAIYSNVFSLKINLNQKK